MLEYSPEALEESAVGFRRVENFLKRAKEIIGQNPELKISKDFAAAMDNDLAVPEGLAVIAELVTAGNAAITANDKKIITENAAHVRGALSILGCDPFDDNWVGDQSNDLTEIVDGLVKLALAEREEARIRQDWQSADRIRDAISAVGISIEDTSSGPRWTITRGENR
jgi:cysteinyl-tRNA synthetase